jgi:hypothetical protein
MTFFLDLWHDLRERRLWPVALGLLAAAVAIPMVMLKPASDGTPAPVPAPAVAKGPTLPAVEVDSSASHNSNLKTFKQRDPFKPLADLKKAGDSSSGASSSSGDASKASSSDSTAGGTPSSPSPSDIVPPTPNSTPPTTTTTTTTNQGIKWFRYTADIRFGQADSMKSMKGVKDFTLLPDDKTAAIVFMGVTNDAKSALFFIADPAFAASGEGECNDKQDCRFVKLQVDDKKNEETFTSLDGSVVYKLKLTKLNREFISANDAQGDATDQQPSAKLGKDLGATAISDASAAVLPRLLDTGALATK